MMHYCSLSDVGDGERGQGFETTQGKFQAEIWALKTIGENFTEVIGRLRWKIRVNRDYPWDLARLEGKYA